jgi:lipopolysaccharide transport system permease protein
MDATTQIEAPTGAPAPTRPKARLKATVYTPRSPVREPGKLVADMWRDLLASRELAWRLFVRDTSAMYRQSILGYVWAFLPPLATTMTFSFLSSQNILKAGETPVPYPAFVMIGTVLWTTFMDALNSPLKAVGTAKPMLAKINFPREALILGGIADVLFNFLVRFSLLIPLFWYYHLPVGPSLLLAPVGIASLIILGLAMGLLLTPLGVLYNDVGRGIGLISGFWMLLTPVVYPTPKHGIGAWLAHWNPVSPFIQTCRDWLTMQPAAQLEAFLILSGIALVALLVSWVIYRVTMPMLVERMGG